MFQMTQMSLVEVRTSSFLTCPGNGGIVSDFVECLYICKHIWSNDSGVDDSSLNLVRVVLRLQHFPRIESPNAPARMTWKN